MNRHMLYLGAFFMVILGCFMKENSWLAVGVGLAWIGSSVNSK